MLATDVPVSDVVSIRPRFLRSVHLERDFYSGNAANGYLLTRGASSALSLLCRGFLDPSYRSQCITGPYGSGKSALALHFAKLLDQSSLNEERQRAPEHVGEELGGLLPSAGQGYVTVLGTGTRDSLADVLVGSVARSLEISGRKRLHRQLLRRHGDVMSGATTSTRALVAMVEDLARLAVEKERADGLLIIVDELGKLLEHAALHPDGGDVQVLQEIAELASRSTNNPVFFITILHQQFSHYAARLGRRHQQEWAKVQQRFFDVPCTLDALDSLRLAASALSSSGHEEVRANPIIRETARQCVSLAPRGTEADFEELCVSCYPLHPTSLLVLQPIFRHFGQNERSLFSFLAANERFSLSDWVHTTTYHREAPPLIHLPNIYDYVFHTLIAGVPPPPASHVWAQVEDSIARLGDAAPEEIEVLKSVALLEIAGEASRISASREVLHLALVASFRSEDDIDRALESLVGKRVVVFRRFRNAFRLWEGSDVDIDECLASAYQILPSHSLVLTVAGELCPSSPLVARRHSFRTGTLRTLSVIAASAEDIETAVSGEEERDGRVVQCVAQNDEQMALAAEFARRLEDPSMIIVIGGENDELAEAAREVAALDRVRNNTPALAGDRVARQELDERRFEAETAFRAEWREIFGPGSRQATWYWNGEQRTVSSSRELASLLSEALDEAFPHAPIVQNELVNRRFLSSQAAGARRNLIEAMISSSDQALLGLTGYPPGRSIYESVLLRSGIHRKASDGRWRFGAPSETDRGLQRAWDHVVDRLRSGQLEPTGISEVFRDLAKRPYGVAEGFVPILFCACLLAHSANLALYEDGAFVPETTSSVMDRLMSQPERFSAVYFELDEERAAVVERFARGFNETNGLVPVVRSLYQRMTSLPQYTKTTRDLPDEAVVVRDTILKARSPERLLFDDLPTVLNCRPFGSSGTDTSEKDNIDAFFDRLNQAFGALIECYPLLLESVRRGLSEVFHVDPEDRDWRVTVYNRASAYDSMAVDPTLRAVINRARDQELDESAYLESVGAAVVGQPPSNWKTGEREHYERAARFLVSQVDAIRSALNSEEALGDDADGYVLTVRGKNGKAVRQVIHLLKHEEDSIEGIVRSLADGSAFGVDRRTMLAAIAEAAYRMANAHEAEVEDGLGGRE